MIVKNRMAVSLAAVLFLSLAGCGSAPAAAASSSMASSVSSVAPQSTETAKEDTEEDNEQDAEEAFIEKYNAYISVGNFMVGELTDTASSYFQRIVLQEEFQFAHENGDYWCDALGRYEEILEKAQKAPSEEPAMGEVDAAFEALYPSLKALADAFEGVYRYAELNSYEQDNYAKAKELHAIIWKSYNEYAELSPAFLTALDSAAEQQRRVSLQQYLDEDMPVRYTLLALLLDAQDIQQSIYGQGITDETVTQLDLTEIQPLYDDLAQKTDEALDYIINDADAIHKEGFQSIDFTGFTYDLKEMKTALTELVQRVKDQEPLESYQLKKPQNSSGTIAKFEEKLSKLIDSYNKL